MVSFNHYKKKDNPLKLGIPIFFFKFSETMGNATTVCSDKTGTLTENKMTVVCASIAEKKVSFNNSIKADCKQINPTGMCLAIENMCVNSTAFEGKDADGHMKFIGPTTECALLEWVNKLGYSYQELRTSSKCVNVYPFNSTVKSMTTVIQVNETNVPTDTSKEYRLYTKGAPEMILQSCTRYLDGNGCVKPISDYVRVSQDLMISSFASRSLRTLALAYRDIDSATFLGECIKKIVLLYTHTNILTCFIYIRVSSRRSTIR